MFIEHLLYARVILVTATRAVEKNGGEYLPSWSLPSRKWIEN